MTDVGTTYDNLPLGEVAKYLGVDEVIKMATLSYDLKVMLKLRGVVELVTIPMNDLVVVKDTTYAIFMFLRDGAARLKARVDVLWIDHFRQLAQEQMNEISRVPLADLYTLNEMRSAFDLPPVQSGDNVVRADPAIPEGVLVLSSGKDTVVVKNIDARPRPVNRFEAVVEELEELKKP